MSRVVVAGATGKVGAVVAAERIARGDEVHVVVRDTSRGASWSGRGARLAVGSLGDARFLAGALAGAGAFLAVLPEDRAARDAHGERRRMAEAMASAVRESRVPRVVVISSLGADLASGTGPIQDLHHLENALRATGAAVGALRAAFFQENIAAMRPLAEQAGIYPSFQPSADVPFPTVATRDVGRLAAGMLDGRDSEIVDLIGPSYSVRDLAAALGVAIGKPLQVVDVPPAGHVAAFESAGASRSVAESYAELFRALGAGIIRPRGDRTERANTKIEETLSALAARTS